MARLKVTVAAEHSTPLSAPAPAEGRAPAPRVSKLATLTALLQASEGATIDALCASTGWQSHSVRGAMAGSLKRKGYVITSTKREDGPRRYRIEASA